MPSKTVLLPYSLGEKVEPLGSWVNKVHKVHKAFCHLSRHGHHRHSDKNTDKVYSDFTFRCFKHPATQRQTRALEVLRHLIVFSIPLGAENSFFDQNIQCLQETRENISGTHAAWEEPRPCLDEVLIQFHCARRCHLASCHGRCSREREPRPQMLKPVHYVQAHLGGIQANLKAPQQNCSSSLNASHSFTVPFPRTLRVQRIARGRVRVTVQHVKIP